MLRSQLQHCLTGLGPRHYVVANSIGIVWRCRALRIRRRFQALHCCRVLAQNPRDLRLQKAVVAVHMQGCL